MATFLGELKYRLYYFFAEKNESIQQEYVQYVTTHLEEHEKHPWKHRWRLIRLNWHYRVCRRKDVLYPDMSKIDNQNEFSNGTTRKLPYMNGAESTVARRLDPIKQAITLLPYDVISFDIFDTLILRPFASPKDLFYLIGKHLNMSGFYAVRIEAEREARERAYILNGTHEVTMDDIYELIEQRTGIVKEEGIETEFQAERQYCRANPYMQQVYRFLKEQGKTIVICSDMYLREKMITELLRKNGYFDYDKLYLSNSYGYSKSEGSLYKKILMDYKGKKIIHIGDNQNADIKRAEENGIDTIYYRSVHDIGKEYRVEGMTELVGSAYAGIVNIHLHNGIRQYEPYYEYGFTYGGLYILGFCNWMYQRAKSEGIEKILFLSRDGDIYKRIFDQYFPEIATEYFLWSRAASTKYTFWYKGVSVFDTILISRVNSKEPITVGNLLTSYELEVLNQYLGEYGLCESSIVCKETSIKIKKMFSDHQKEIEDIYSIQMGYLEEYTRNKIGNAKKLAVVDVGWLGSGPTALKHLIEKKFNKDCMVKCWIAGATSTTKENITADVMDGTIEAYLFWSGNNRDSFHTHTRTNLTSKNRINNALIEMFTQACSPSYLGFDNNGNMRFGIPEVENYQAIQMMHRGIEDFCSIYFKTFSNDPFMYNISGYDAYRPFKLAIRNLEYIKNNFSEFSFPQIIGNQSEGEEIETIGSLISKK